jgi:hypothetical protein
MKLSNARSSRQITPAVGGGDPGLKGELSGVCMAGPMAHWTARFAWEGTLRGGGCSEGGMAR